MVFILMIGLMGMYSKEYYENKFKELGFKVLENKDGYSIIEDLDGYKYRKRNQDANKKKFGVSKFDRRNPFILHNLQLFSKKEKHEDIEIISSEDGKVEFLCHTHGKFFTTIDNFTHRKYLCPECAKINRGLNRRTEDEKIIKKCKKMNCSFVKSYIGKNGKLCVDFICNVHKEKGVQTKMWDKMKNAKNPCIYCANNYKHTTEDFIKEIKLIDDTIKIIGEYEGAAIPITCRCGKCGSTWKQQPRLVRIGRGCPVCNMPKGEKRIARFLESENIMFETQKSFNGLVGVNGGLLSYDFCINDKNILIEFNGDQHYRPVSFTKEEDKFEQFKKQQEHDKRKKEYAKNNGYKLIEIPYEDYDNIEELLKKELNT